MNIVRKDGTPCKFKDLYPGDVFIFNYENSEYYMKIYDSYDNNNESFNYVTLNNGKCGTYINSEYHVIKIDCELVLK